MMITAVRMRAGGSLYGVAALTVVVAGGCVLLQGRMCGTCTRHMQGLASTLSLQAAPLRCAWQLPCLLPVVLGVEAVIVVAVASCWM